ncbi:MAG: hypothetical protein ACI3XQ_03860 [Eubacteriales bacterium]
MFNNEYQCTTTAGRVCLEISLKPFGLDKSKAGYESVARKLFEQWLPMLKHADGCSVLFWTSDGSEILEYAGRMEDTFEWCKYIGIGNWDRYADPESRKKNLSLHAFPILYMENPPEMTYGDLKEIVSAVKRVGKEITGLEIEVGETFDPGPEFAYSEFKYERHPEIAPGDTMGSKKWLHCASRLHADSRPYAAYPDGIPEGTHIGEFLGRQCMAMKRDIGFDYIWLSNGFGFSLASWDWLGETFDGKQFNSDGGTSVRKSIMEFWKYFSAEIGDTRIEVRGSNLSTGMDISAHGCPIEEIYRQKNLVAPPNSPWAPLDYRFGLELSGFMTHIADLPDHGFLFRYYIHDPWWLNSPWFDRYDRSPHDIYLPLAIARLDEDGQVTKPFGISLLSADDSFGRMPERCPNEVVPHLMSAYNDYSDAPGLVTWIYPIDTYSTPAYQKNHNAGIFMGDWFMESVIDQGFPVNTVISDGNFCRVDKKIFLDGILITPVPEAGSAMEAALFEALTIGCKVILYGSLRNASKRLLDTVGITIGEELEGNFRIFTDLKLDRAEVDDYSDSFEHPALFSDGGIGEMSDGSAHVSAWVEQDGKKRAYSTYQQKANLVWIRGSFPHKTQNCGHLPPLKHPSESFVPSLLVRASMQCFGFPMTFELYSVNDKIPISMFSRCRRAMFFNIFAKDASVRMHFTTPDGAPAFDNSEFILENDEGVYSLSRWIHTDCRVFIKQKKRSKVSVKKEAVGTHIDADERITVSGLADAQVTVYPTDGGLVWLGSGYEPEKIPGGFLQDAERGCYVAEHLTGDVSILWQARENFGDYKKLEFLRNDDGKSS